MEGYFWQFEIVSASAVDQSGLFTEIQTYNLDGKAKPFEVCKDKNNADTININIAVRETKTNCSISISLIVDSGQDSFVVF